MEKWIARVGYSDGTEMEKEFPYTANGNYLLEQREQYESVEDFVMCDWKVTIGAGLDQEQTYTVKAANEREALDMVVDRIEEAETNSLLFDYYDLYDACEVGQTVDEYAEANGLVCCGKSGAYVQLINICAIGG